MKIGMTSYLRKAEFLLSYISLICLLSIPIALQCTHPTLLGKTPLFLNCYGYYLRRITLTPTPWEDKLKRQSLYSLFVFLADLIFAWLVNSVQEEPILTKGGTAGFC